MNQSDLNAMTFDQRQRMYAAEDAAKARIRAELAERTADKSPRSPYASYITELESDLEHATRAEREGIRRRLKMVRPQHEAWEQEQKAIARAERLASNPAVVNAREHAAAFGRTPPAGADAEQVQLAVALALSDEWEDASSLVANYWGEVRKIEEAALALAEREAMDASHTAIAAEREAAQAGLRRAETAKRLHDATNNAGGSNE